MRQEGKQAGAPQKVVGSEDRLSVGKPLDKTDNVSSSAVVRMMYDPFSSVGFSQFPNALNGPRNHVPQN
jgi:hypothetical protein